MRKVMIKKLVIKLFDLTNINDMLKQAKEAQKKLDKRHFNEDLEEEIYRLSLKHSLDLQEKEAQIEMLEDEVKKYKIREKELDNREFSVKANSKANAFMATKISSAVDELGLNINNFVGLMRGVKAEADSHKLKIEQK